MASPRIEIEETNLEDLILLGEDKKIPIIIEYPNGDTTIKAKALIKQLTLKEMDKIKPNSKNNAWEMSMKILETALLKQDGSNFSKEELLALPMGVVNAIAEQIMKASGVEIDKELANF